jgi:hypothetical protein
MKNMPIGGANPNTFEAVMRCKMPAIAIVAAEA